MADKEVVVGEGCGTDCDVEMSCCFAAVCECAGQNVIGQSPSFRGIPLTWESERDA